ncbi:MAG: NnrS family protein [Acidobacteria bacterium]|nr:NnrS family protein [Acidobacteriota bacterium]
MEEITKLTSVAEIVKRCPTARRIFDKYGLEGCGGEHGPTEPLGFFAAVHKVDAEKLVAELNAEIKSPSEKKYEYKESLGDVIYRRFFKAGIAVVLSVGCLWGAINLFDIGMSKEFLQLRLVPSIHAHGHAMVFGWVGLFVMGFAYQAFPRFKFTKLWRPDLANLTFVLMLAGIAARVAAELLQPMPVGIGLGIFSAAAELTAVGLFLTIIVRTARQSAEPRSPYEKFIFGAFFWFVVQAVLSQVFFFAKVTAEGQQQLIGRVALLGGPLRDIQLLGFAALIIAGVSQRLIPAVYGLPQPKKDRRTLIFRLMNGSLVLNVASYVLVVSTHNPVFAVGLEISYILMVVWAVLLVKQLGIFSRVAEPDRAFKFIRAAYAWLLVAMAMMPFFIVYGVLTRQVFAHSYMGAHRHAFTVGFISLMILGVASRVVPILAGVEAKRVSALWGPFILINVGNAGRVVLQILTDFIPQVAYPLVGLTGFVEVTALAWWGVELWHTMNLSTARRTGAVPSPLPLAAR